MKIQKKKTIIEHYKQLYANKFNIVGEMDNFLGTHNPPKLNQEEIDNLNRLITKNEIEYMIKKKLPTNKSPGQDRWLHKQILSNIQRRNYTNSSQTLPEDWS